MSKWISVKDKLPELNHVREYTTDEGIRNIYSDDVLCIDAEGKAHICYLEKLEDDENADFYENEYGECKTDIVKWMPIPTEEKKLNSMTLEELRHEMIKRGRPATSAYSKTVAYVLDILTDNGTDFVDLWETKAQIEEERKTLKSLNIKFDVKYKEFEEERKQFDKSTEETVNYIKEWYDTFESMETPQGRDTLRKAQFYSSRVKRQTDSKIYALGLAKILSSGENPQMERMQKL